MLKAHPVVGTKGGCAIVPFNVFDKIGVPGTEIKS